MVLQEATPEPPAAHTAPASTAMHGSTAPMKKLSKKQRRKRAQRKNILTMVAIVAMVAVLVGAAVAFNNWQNNRITTLPQDQRVIAVVDSKETPIAPFSACELDDASCTPNMPVEVDLTGVSEFTLKLPEDVSNHDWALLEIFDDPGANSEQYFAADEAQEVTVPVESPKTAEDGTHPKLAVVEIHSMLVGLDSQGEQSPFNVVWSIKPKDVALGSGTP